MMCADGFPVWSASQKRARIVATVIEPKPIPSPPSVQPFYSHAQPHTFDALLLQAERYLLDEHLSSCQETLSVAVDLIERDAQRADYEVLLGRLLSRQNAPECEGHLLKAQRLIIGEYGEQSPRRVPVLRELVSWYGRTGEVSQLLSTVEAANTLNISEPVPRSVKKRYVEDLSYARILRHNGLYKESVYLLRLFVWEVLLSRPTPMPREYEVPVSVLSDGKISKLQAATLHLLFALNCTDDEQGELPLATAMLDVSHLLLEDVPGQEVLRAEIEQERGRIARKRGELDRAIRHYDTAMKMLKAVKTEDPFLMYELFVSKGVVHAQQNDLKDASTNYEKAWALAEKLQFTDQLYVSKLLSSRASLALRRGDFNTCVLLASQAADLLLLKASGRHKERGLAHFRQGEAFCHLGKFREARQALSSAESCFKEAGV